MRLACDVSTEPCNGVRVCVRVFSRPVQSDDEAVHAAWELGPTARGNNLLRRGVQLAFFSLTGSAVAVCNVTAVRAWLVLSFQWQ